MHKIVRTALVSALALTVPVLPLSAQAVGAVAASTEDARLTAFLDTEFAQELKKRPQLATRLGIKDGQD